MRASSIRIEFDLVDDGIVKRPVDHVLEPELHVVAQIVEAELVVGAVGDIGGIGLAALVVVEVVEDAADRETEKTVDLSHPLGVAAREIVVDRHHVHAVAGERVQVNREGRDQGLAFAGLHLGDHAAVQHDPAHQLHVEMALAEGALGGFAHRRKRVGQDVVELGAVGQLPLELRGPGAQLVIRQRDQLRLQLVDRHHDVREALDVAVIGGAEQPPG